jgi:hypothetical protein
MTGKLGQTWPHSARWRAEWPAYSGKLGQTSPDGPGLLATWASSGRLGRMAGRFGRLDRVADLAGSWGSFQSGKCGYRYHPGVVHSYKQRSRPFQIRNHWSRQLEKTLPPACAANSNSKLGGPGPGVFHSRARRPILNPCPPANSDTVQAGSRASGGAGVRISYLPQSTYKRAYFFPLTFFHFRHVT